MVYGDAFELHGYKWFVLADYGDGNVLAVQSPVSNLSQPMLVNSVIDNETRELAVVEKTGQ